MTVWTWPTSWYRFATAKFSLRSMSQVAARPWTGSRSVYGPHAQIWHASLTLAPQLWDEHGQAMSSFFSRLGGQAGLIRIGHSLRYKPQRDRLRQPVSETFSDGFGFDDDTGFTSGDIEDVVYLTTGAERGATYVIVGGLPALEAACLRRGDLFELRPNGIHTEGPNLYEIQVNAPTDASGHTGVQIRPPLRQSFAAGDMVVLRRPTGVFRLIDDDQGIPEANAAHHMQLGFDLIEAIV